MSLEEQKARMRAGAPLLVPYDSLWPARFTAAAAAIAEACAGLALTIEHIGSTSVPGLAAKPVLDMMPGFRSHDDGYDVVPAMEALGYEYRGEYGLPGRHYFTRWLEGDTHVWKHNVHGYAIGYIEWVRHLTFRDALRADPAARIEYEALKYELVRLHPNDIAAYASAKSSFVERIIAARGGPARAPTVPGGLVT